MAWDPGLQVERTAYAWMRTCLSMALASAAVIKLANSRDLWVAELLSGVAMCLWFAMAVVTWRRSGKRTRDLIRGRPYKPQASMLLAALNAVLLGAAVFSLIEF